MSLPVTTGRPPRWIELVPPVVLAVSFGVMAAIRPNAVRDLFSGTQAIVVTVAIVAAWLLLSRLVLPRLVRNGWVRVGILSALAVALVVALILPTIVDKKVVEALPRASVPRIGPADEVGTATTAPATPVQVASAALVGRGGHEAAGSVVIYRQPDGTFVVGLEGIDVESGPDFHVYVVQGRGREEPGDGGVRLDGLRGNQGTQYYPVPGTVDLQPGEWTVLIWCRLYAVPVANATPV